MVTAIAYIKVALEKLTFAKLLINIFVQVFKLVHCPFIKVVTLYNTIQAWCIFMTVQYVTVYVISLPYSILPCLVLQFTWSGISSMWPSFVSFYSEWPKLMQVVVTFFFRFCMTLCYSFQCVGWPRYFGVELMAAWIVMTQMLLVTHIGTNFTHAITATYTHMWYVVGVH